MSITERFWLYPPAYAFYSPVLEPGLLRNLEIGRSFASLAAFCLRFCFSSKADSPPTASWFLLGFSLAFNLACLF